MLTAPVQARVTAAQAARESPVVVELFTSEGCSSCPPADALLRELNGHLTPAGHRVIGISEHVTYWNGLGWSDPYSANVYTDRQNGYGQRFHLDSVYTPQMVVNGRTETVGSRRASVLAALDRQPAFPLQVEVLSARRSAGHIDVVASVLGEVPSTGADLFAAVTDDADQTAISRGENAGQTLHHAAVARSISKVGTAQPNPAPISFSIPIPSVVQADRLRAHHLVVFAQVPSFGPILGADTRVLE